VVECWGHDDEGQLDAYPVTGLYGPTSVVSPVPAPDFEGAALIAGGHYFTCAIVSSGTVSCCGQLAGAGQPMFDPTGTVTLEALPVPGLHDAVSIAAGAHHVCALLPGGAIACWGGNTNGQLGDGTTSPGGPMPVMVKW